LQTPVAPRSGPASVEAAAGQGDCDNSCRTVSYTPKMPCRNVGVWVLRDGRWQLAISQQSTIQSANPLPAVAAKK
jgi:hypothetical protein